MRNTKRVLRKIHLLAFAVLPIVSILFLATGSVSAAPTPCGDSAHGGPVPLGIGIGCIGKGNPIADASFAIIRFLSDGVGLVIIASIIVAGIQYSSSRGDPQSTAKAVKRIQSTMLALLIYIFSYAILNYIIPNGVLQ